MGMLYAATQTLHTATSLSFCDHRRQQDAEVQKS